MQLFKIRFLGFLMYSKILSLRLRQVLLLLLSLFNECPEDKETSIFQTIISRFYC